jgi:hypothetical protein
MEMKITNGGGGCNDDMFTSCCWLTGGNQAVACRGDQSTTTKGWAPITSINRKNVHTTVQQEPIVSVHFVSGRGYLHNNFFCMYVFCIFEAEITVRHALKASHNPFCPIAQ